MSDVTLRRGKPETRSHYERAKDEFDKAKGVIRVSERLVECPSCPTPNVNMTKRTSTREPEHVQVQLECHKDKSHSEDRYGFYSNEGSE